MSHLFTVLRFQYNMRILLRIARAFLVRWLWFAHWFFQSCCLEFNCLIIKNHLKVTALGKLYIASNLYSQGLVFVSAWFWYVFLTLYQNREIFSLQGCMRIMPVILTNPLFERREEIIEAETVLIVLWLTLLLTSTIEIKILCTYQEYYTYWHSNTKSMFDE